MDADVHRSDHACMSRRLSVLPLDVNPLFQTFRRHPRSGFLIWAVLFFSAILLWMAFPPAIIRTGWIWVALVPLLWVGRCADPRRAFWQGCFFGAVFWLCSLTWLWRLIANQGPWPLVVFGHMALALYCGCYVGLFTWISARMWRSVHHAEHRGMRLLAFCIGEPLIWVGVEYLRCILFTGFPWNALGVTQVENPCLRQLASLGGVYVISAMIVLVNGGVTNIACKIHDAFCQLPREEGFCTDRCCFLEGAIPVILLLVSVHFGHVRLEHWKSLQAVEPRWQIALIQPNAPSIFERNDDNVEKVRATLRAQTALAAETKPDLVVWPETSLIGALPYDQEAMTLACSGAITAHASLLAGTVEVEAGSSGAPNDFLFYNAAWLFTPDGRPSVHYHKQHLVPFGEYIPLESIFPVLGALSPVGFSCTPGRESVVMHVEPRVSSRNPKPASLAFSPLICFEDTVAELSRQAVRAGARLLVNLTNDAWFDGSTEPDQHAAQAVFRCIETGVPMVRAANTGVSCAIDPIGHCKTLQQEGQKTGFPDHLSISIHVPSAPISTCYQQWGDWMLARPAVLLLIMIVLLTRRTSRQ